MDKDKAINPMRKEYNKSSSNVNDVSPEAVQHIESMSSRRTMSAEENQELWTKLNRKWGVRDLWYPLISVNLPSAAIAFHTTYFDQYMGTQVLRDILISHDIRRIYEIREFECAFEIDTVLAEFAYKNGECYWTYGDMDWLIYASHESSITFAGDWLINDLKNAWSDWEKCIYTDWDQA